MTKFVGVPWILKISRESFWSSRAMGNVAPTFSMKGVFRSGRFALSMEMTVKFEPPCLA